MTSERRPGLRARQPEAVPGSGATGPWIRWFRVLAVLSPLLLIGLVELGLRVAGYGFATAFFVESRQNGQAVLVENPKFGWRFFPPAVARSPQPLALLKTKAPGSLRIFVFGESAAMGDPEPAYGFPRQLERILRARHPDRQIEVVNVGMTAISSHVIRQIAKDCAPLAGDYWLIYAGNNEVIGPFGAGTVFGRQAASLRVVRLTLALKSTRIGQLLASLTSKALTEGEWEGMESFLQNQVRWDDPRLKAVYGNFEANLDAIIGLGRRSGAKVIAATMPVNLKDCPPFGSLHGTRFDASKAAEWEARFERGKQAQAAGRSSEALATYQEAAELDPDFAELVFRRAQCELALGQGPAAATDFKLARDLDTLRFRADARLNEVIRQTAAARQVPLIDAERDISQGPDGTIVGEETFYDHVHPNFAGNYRVASLFAAEIEKELGTSNQPAGDSFMAENEVARQLAFSDFDRRRVGEEMRLRLKQPPFSSQINAQKRDQRWEQTLASLQTPPADSVPVYREALARAPKDWVLNANYGRLLEAAKDPGALAEWREVARLLPHRPDAWLRLAYLAHTGGRLEEAEGFLREGLARKPDSVEALNELALLRAEQGNTREASRQFEKALTLKPRFATARINLAVVLAKAGDIAGATAQYEMVLRCETNNVPARINLGRLLAEQGKTDAAIGLYTEALGLDAADPEAHYNLANALAAKGNHAEALSHYAAAVQSRPEFPEARSNLALELARLGKEDEAFAEFGEVVRLTPAFAQGHFNYGVALAKRQRFGEAAEQFRETLRLQPEHTKARAALEKALQLGARGASRKSETDPSVR